MSNVCGPNWLMHRSRLSFTAVVVVLIILLQQPATGKLNPGPEESYLAREFAWSMFIDVKDVDHYLSYRGSSLHPLTKVRITYRCHPGSSPGKREITGIYEELWYYKGLPVGSRRMAHLNLPEEQPGAFVAKHMGANPEHALVAANAALRLLLDFQTRHLNVAVFLVPANQYDTIAGGCQRYRFAPLSDQEKGSLAGPQLSIHLRSYPGDKDEMYYYQE